jgi:hypothetical protein
MGSDDQTNRPLDIPEMGSGANSPNGMSGCINKLDPYAAHRMSKTLALNKIVKTPVTSICLPVAINVKDWSSAGHAFVCLFVCLFVYSRLSNFSAFQRLSTLPVTVQI